MGKRMSVVKSTTLKNVKITTTCVHRPPALLLASFKFSESRTHNYSSNAGKLTQQPPVSLPAPRMFFFRCQCPGEREAVCFWGPGGWGLACRADGEQSSFCVPEIGVIGLPPWRPPTPRPAPPQYQIQSLLCLMHHLRLS